jgi:alkanesulfonate monooxygenase SsuD/methylene tetrahydromethanopterin reductase-like flavin-dependent oxidoreductase (luciferase family)
MAAERQARSGSDAAKADGKPVGFAVGHLAFAGTPDQVADQIRAFNEATGVGVFDVMFSGGGLTAEERRRSITLFGTEVIPRLRSNALQSNAMSVSHV